MTRKEAQEILLLYRPSFDDPDDEPMQEALDLARQDPELAAWFEQHCQLQRKLIAVFKEIRVPEGLKEQIISERKSRFAIGKQRLTMAAACVCILASALLIAGQLGLLRLRPSDTFASFRERVVGDVQRTYPNMDLVTNSLPEIERYLAKRGQLNISIPDQLAKVQATGCVLFPWHGRTVSMICFQSPKAPSPTAPDVFLFVLDRSDINAAPANSTPEVKRVKNLVTASWTQGDKIYLLSGVVEEALLRRYL